MRTAPKLIKDKTLPHSRSAPFLQLVHLNCSPLVSTHLKPWHPCSVRASLPRQAMNAIDWWTPQLQRYSPPHWLSPLPSRSCYWTHELSPHLFSLRGCPRPEAAPAGLGLSSLSFLPCWAVHLLLSSTPSGDAQNSHPRQVVRLSSSWSCSWS